VASVLAALVFSFCVAPSAFAAESPTLNCDRELRKVHEALQGWRRANDGVYPEKLADLVTAGLLPRHGAYCPNVRHELSGGDARHELITSRKQGGDVAGVYEYELFPAPPAGYLWTWLPTNTPAYTRRDLKLMLLRRPFAEQVPILRCSSHPTAAPNNPLISLKAWRNLTSSGQTYWSGEYWEPNWVDDVPLAARGANLIFGLKGPPFFRDVPPTSRPALDLRQWANGFGDHPWWWDLPLFDEPPNRHWTPHLRAFFLEQHGQTKKVDQRNWWINGLVQLQGKTGGASAEQFQKFSMPGLPWERTGLRVNRKFRKAEWLQGTVWVGSPGEAAGWLVWHYESGAMERVPIVYGRSTARFWSDQNQLDRESDFPEPEWQHFEPAAEVGRDRWLRLYVQTWENPLPNEKVAMLDFVSNRESPASPFIVAINTYP
jgi:hypothetical protein